jgi:hypothetical protein
MTPTPDELHPDDPYAEYWNSIPTNEEIEADDPPRRGRAKNYAGDGVTNIRMCQTEVALRLGRCLAESPLLEGTVYLFLGGVELTRREDEVLFPVARYLSRWGFTKDRGRAEARPRWIGFYSHKRHSRKLLLNFNKFDGHVMAFLATGRRLIVHCSAGNVTETRSPAEVHDLNRAMGRAVGWHGTKPDDIIAVCTPRSERFRKLTAERAKSVGVQRSGLKFLHVDRGGGIIGLTDGETL